jgi:hypothetical protein
MVRMCLLQEPHRLLSQSVKFFLPQTNVLWYVREFVAINVRFGKMLTISFRAQRLEHDFVSEERYDQAKSTRVIPRTDELRYAVKGENNGHVLQCCSSTAGPLTSSSLTARKEAGTLSRVLFSSPRSRCGIQGGIHVRAERGGMRGRSGPGGMGDALAIIIRRKISPN